MNDFMLETDIIWFAILVTSHLPPLDATSLLATCSTLQSSIRLKIIQPADSSAVAETSVIWRGTDDDEEATQFWQILRIDALIGKYNDDDDDDEIMHNSRQESLTKQQQKRQQELTHSIFVKCKWKSARPPARAWQAKSREKAVFVVRREIFESKEDTHMSTILPLQKCARSNVQEGGIVMPVNNNHGVSIVGRTSCAPPRADLQPVCFSFHVPERDRNIVVRDNEEAFHNKKEPFGGGKHTVQYELWCQFGRGRRALQISDLTLSRVIYQNAPNKGRVLSK